MSDTNSDSQSVPPGAPLDPARFSWQVDETCGEADGTHHLDHVGDRVVDGEDWSTNPEYNAPAVN